jgi:hypothetical protein
MAGGRRWEHGDPTASPALQPRFIPAIAGSTRLAAALGTCACDRLGSGAAETARAAQCQLTRAVCPPRQPGRSRRALAESDDRARARIRQLRYPCVEMLAFVADRSQSDTLCDHYTHEFLSHILGANRKSITLAAQSMKTAGLIAYHRGMIQVLDRPGLEKASCECYKIVKARFDAFLSPPATAVQETKGGRTGLNA